MCIIYALVDPDTDEIRYVGKTVRSAHVRLLQHISDARCVRSKTHNCYWVRSLLDSGKTPQAFVIEEVESSKDLEARECYWISYFRKCGARLNNHTIGGEGLKNPDQTTREKMRHSAKNRTKEHRENLSKSIKEARKIYNPRLGKKHSEEAKEKIRDKALGRPAHNKGKSMSEEQKKKLSKWRSGRVFGPRKEFCSKGHLNIKENRRLSKDGQDKGCRLCKNLQEARRRAMTKFKE